MDTFHLHQITEARIQAGYATDYGLANIVRVDLLSGAYGAPRVLF